MPDYGAFLSEHYLAAYLPAGGAAVKMAVVGGAATAARVERAVGAACDAHDCVFVPLSAQDARLDQVEQLGGIRDFFPTAEEFAWTDLLQTPVDSGDLFRGVVQSLVYAAVFTALGFRHFARRDVTS